MPPNYGDDASSVVSKTNLCGDDASRAGAGKVSPRVLRGGTDTLVLCRSDYRSVEEMAGQLRGMLKSLPDNTNYSIKIQIVNPCDH